MTLLFALLLFTIAFAPVVMMLGRSEARPALLFTRVHGNARPIARRFRAARPFRAPPV